MKKNPSLDSIIPNGESIMKTYTLVLTNDYHPTTKMTLETHKNFDKAPSKKDISDWLIDIDAEFNFPYDYYNVTLNK
jgi:hypothetical protein